MEQTKFTFFIFSSNHRVLNLFNFWQHSTFRWLLAVLPSLLRGGKLKNSWTCLPALVLRCICIVCTSMRQQENNGKPKKKKNKVATIKQKIQSSCSCARNKLKKKNYKQTWEIINCLASSHYALNSIQILIHSLTFSYNQTHNQTSMQTLFLYWTDILRPFFYIKCSTKYSYHLKRFNEHWKGEKKSEKEKITHKKRIKSTRTKKYWKK